MQTYQSTPDFYNDYISHFNKNHDPRSGQFASGSNGVYMQSRRAKKHLIKAQEKDKKLTDKAEKYLTKDILKSRKSAKRIKTRLNSDGSISYYPYPTLKIRRKTNRAAMKAAKYYSKMTKKYGEGWRNYNV